MPWWSSSFFSKSPAMAQCFSSFFSVFYKVTNLIILPMRTRMRGFFKSCSQNHFSGVVGMSYGFFLSTICDTTADAMKMAISSFFPVLMVVSGYFPSFSARLTDRICLMDREVIMALQIILISLVMAGVWRDLAVGGDAQSVASTACLVLATDCKHAGQPHTIISF